MPRFEYKVVPAPKKGVKAKGVRATEDRFANALEGVMNKLGAEGWDYLRTDTLPCEERVGLTGRTTNYQNMLVFRRVLAEVEKAPGPQVKAPATPVVLKTPVEPGPAPALPGAARKVVDKQTEVPADATNQ